MNRFKGSYKPLPLGMGFLTVYGYREHVLLYLDTYIAESY
jgi:hypothetical protein